MRQGAERLLSSLEPGPRRTAIEAVCTVLQHPRLVDTPCFLALETHLQTALAQGTPRSTVLAAVDCCHSALKAVGMENAAAAALLLQSAVAAGLAAQLEDEAQRMRNPAEQAAVLSMLTSVRKAASDQAVPALQRGLTFLQARTGSLGPSAMRPICTFQEECNDYDTWKRNEANNYRGEWPYAVVCERGRAAHIFNELLVKGKIYQKLLPAVPQLLDDALYTPLLSVLEKCSVAVEELAPYLDVVLRNSLTLFEIGYIMSQIKADSDTTKFQQAMAMSMFKLNMRLHPGRATAFAALVPAGAADAAQQRSTNVATTATNVAHLVDANARVEAMLQQLQQQLQLHQQQLQQQQQHQQHQQLLEETRALRERDTVGSALRAMDLNASSPYKRYG